MAICGGRISDKAYIVLMDGYNAGSAECALAASDIKNILKRCFPESKIEVVEIEGRSNIVAIDPSIMARLAPIVKKLREAKLELEELRGTK